MIRTSGLAVNVVLRILLDQGRILPLSHQLPAIIALGTHLRPLLASGSFRICWRLTPSREGKWSSRTSSAWLSALGARDRRVLCRMAIFFKNKKGKRGRRKKGKQAPHLVACVRVGVGWGGTEWSVKVDAM